MEQFKITFWREPYKNDNPFLNGVENYITSATIVKSTSPDMEKYHVSLNDIGLRSNYGDFEIIYRNGFWQTTDKDSAEFNLLKWNIINGLMLYK